MKKLLLALAATLCIGSAQAQWQTWSPERKTMFVAHEVLLLADWSTTRFFARNKDNFPYHYETNLFLGKYPSVDKVDAYFMGAMIGTYFLNDWLGERNSLIFLTGANIIQAGYFGHNIGIGWKARF